MTGAIHEVHYADSSYSFGVVASVLELVPIASIFFAFTNQVGAALWAADLENRSTTAPGLRKQAEQAM